MPAQRPVQPPILEPDLLRVLGHELRSPLASLLGYAELMRDDDEAADPHAVGRFVEVVVRNSQRQLDLVEDVLLAVALDTGALQPVAESCSPMRALSVCLAGLPVELHVSPLDLVDAPAVLADPALSDGPSPAARVPRSPGTGRSTGTCSDSACIAPPMWARTTTPSCDPPRAVRWTGAIPLVPRPGRASRGSWVNGWPS